MRESLDLQPTLLGRRIVLRPLTADDFDPLFAVASDPMIWEQHPATDRHRKGPFTRFFEEALASGGALVVEDNESRRVVGSVRLHWRSDGELEIGWIFLARSHWGGRYSAEVVSLMLDHVFRLVPRVLWLAGVDNHRSQRAAENLGAVRVGTRLDASGHENHAYFFQRPDQPT